MGRSTKHPALTQDTCQAYKFDTSEDLDLYSHKTDKLFNTNSSYKIMVDRRIFQNYMRMRECESCRIPNPLTKRYRLMIMQM